MSYTASYIVNSSSAQGTTDFQFTFPYIKEEHIEVYVNYSKITQGTGSNQYQVITNVSPKLVRLNTGIASANLRIEVRRNSSLGTPLVDYADGSTLTANDLDTSALQSLYIDQELKDSQIKTVSSDDATGLPTLSSQRLTNVADPTAAQDAVTKAYLERTGSIASAQILNGTIVNADVNTSAAIDGTKVTPNFGSQNIVTSGTVDGRDVSNDGIKLDSIETGATGDQTNAEIRTAVEAASDSNVFTDADHSKLNAIEAGATADQTNAEIRAAVEAATDSNVFTDADHSKLNAIEASATADQTVSEIKSLIAGSPLDNSHLAADSVRVSEIKDGEITSAKLNPGAVVTNSEQSGASVNDTSFFTTSASDARYFNVSTGDTIKDGDTFPDNDTTIATTAAINDRIIDLVDDVGGFVPIASETNFPTANPDVNNGAGTLVSVKAIGSTRTPSGGTVSISNGSGSNTVTITGCGSTVLTAGFGVIVETTSTLHTYAFHRLVPKATEVTTVAGNISNINSVASNQSNINSAVGNASNINSAVSNATNINSVAGNISNVNTVAGNNTNINTVAGANSNISTVATNISNVNNVGGSIANVNTVASNLSTVNDFGARYRVASSDPTSNNDEGDLVFNTTSNELRVYNGSAWQGGVTATGNLAGLGANTFTGHQSLGDNIKVIFGAGGDLEIFHNGTDTRISNATGELELMNPTVLKHRAVTHTFASYADDETFAVFNDNGSCDLYYDNSKKFETTSAGITVTGNIAAGDNSELQLGTGGDMVLRHNGSNSFIENSTGNLILRPKTDEEGLILRADGAAELYYDNGKKFETTSSGATLTGSLTTNGTTIANGHVRLRDHTGTEDGQLMLGTGNDLRLWHDGSNSYLTNSTGALHVRNDGIYFKNAAGSENFIDCSPNAEVSLFWNGNKKIETSSQGVWLGDNSRVTLGGSAGSPDCHFYHDATDTNIQNITGDLIIKSNADGDKAIVVKNGAGTELYYDNGKKLETSSTGVYVRASGASGLWIDNQDNAGKDIEFIANGDKLRFNDQVKATFGNSDDLQIFHDNASYIKHDGTGDLFIRDGSSDRIRSRSAGQVELCYDDNVKFSTSPDGVIVYGDLFLDNPSTAGRDIHWDVSDNALKVKDNTNINFGDDNDLAIYHNGVNSVIYDQGTGNLSLMSSSGMIVLEKSNGEPMGTFAIDGAVSLYHDNSKKFETTSTGVNVTGTLTVNGSEIGGGGDTPNTITANDHTASSGELVIINGTGRTVTLPSSPSSGDYVKVRVLDENYCTVARNSSNIESVAEDFTMNSTDAFANFVFIDATRGWLVCS